MSSLGDLGIRLDWNHVLLNKRSSLRSVFLRPQDRDGLPVLTPNITSFPCKLSKSDTLTGSYMDYRFTCSGSACPITQSMESAVSEIVGLGCTQESLSASLEVDFFANNDTIRAGSVQAFTLGSYRCGDSLFTFHASASGYHGDSWPRLPFYSDNFVAAGLLKTTNMVTSASIRGFILSNGSNPRVIKSIIPTDLFSSSGGGGFCGDYDLNSTVQSAIAQSFLNLANSMKSGMHELDTSLDLLVSEFSSRMTTYKQMATRPTVLGYLAFFAQLHSDEITFFYDLYGISALFHLYYNDSISTPTTWLEDAIVAKADLLMDKITETVNPSAPAGCPSTPTFSDVPDGTHSLLHKTSFLHIIIFV